MNDRQKTVIFIRHGQSLHNPEPVFQAENVDLSNVGENQAELIANRIKILPIEALISSTQPRARQTAEKVSQTTGKKIEFSDLFIERVKPKIMDGKPWADENASRVWRAWERTLYTPKKRFEDGENYDDIIQRADEALKFLENRTERTLVVVTHGYFLRAIMARVLVGEMLTGAIMKNFQTKASMENTGITIFNYTNAFEEDYAWRLWTYNDHAHLLNEL